ncbi:MAG: putative toxin-antitoxin system toxin component, PIN family [Polyangiales bacterium]
MPLRAVFDTNVLLSLFAFGGGRFAALREAVEDGRVRCVTRGDCLDEYRRVVASASLRLDEGARLEAVSRYARLAEVIAHAEPRAALPRCGDPDDQKFLELAVTAGADYLVTLDRALLALAPAVTPLRVVVPRRLREALRAS